MRSAQVYRWQIPMDAGVVLRERRLKTRDGLFVYLRDGERDGWGEISPLPGFSQETLDDAQSALLAWVTAWRQGENAPLPDVPSVAFGVSCALAELNDELPLAAGALAKTGKYDAVIALGTVIRGGTAHFEYVAGGASNGLAHVAQDSEIPVAFGVLTTESIEQAIERAGTKAGNKGAEAALTALEMINVLKAIKA